MQRLTKKALAAINTQRTRLLIALAVEEESVSEMTVRRYIAANNKRLTRSAVLDVIRKETGLPDSEILEESRSKRLTGRKPNTQISPVQ